MATTKEIAEKLDGVGMPELPADIIEEAKASGIAIVHGGSDDLMEFRGAIYDEVGCYGGGDAYVGPTGILQEPECGCEWATKEWDKMKSNGWKIKALWCRPLSDGPATSWSYETDIPHETFKIMEDGAIYCIGIVFQYLPPSK